MLRIILLALTVSGALSACSTTPVAYPTPPQPAMDPIYSDSIGFTHIGQEPF